MTFINSLPIISVVALTVARLVELGRKRDVVKGPVQESLTFRLFFVVGSLIALGSIAEYLWEGAQIYWPLYVLGWVIGLLSFYIRWSAIAALGRFWSLHVEIRDNHEFVKSGPFRFVRHPVYFSMILELLAFSALCHAWMAAVATPLLYVPALLLRVRLEEKALLLKFGPAYEEYQRTVPAIFPLPW